MTFNPEFRRNIALQFTWSRLIAAPLVLLIPTYAFHAVLNQHYGFLQNIAELVGGVLIVGLWGTRRAADSLAEEVSGGTWEGQRMSGLGAWQMTWGKLIGSTSFIWYCAAITAVIAFWAGHQAWSIGYATRPAWQVAFDFVIGGLMAQAAAFAVGLVLMRKAAQHRRLTITLAQTCGVMLFVFLVRGGMDHGGSFHATISSFAGATMGVVWYGQAVDPITFHAAMILVYCAWALIAAYRLMRNELQYRSLPWVWTAFLVFVVVWAAGFNVPLQFGLVGRLVAPFLALVLLTYLSFFADYRDPVRYRWALIALRSRNWTEAVAALPWWVISYVFAAALAAAICWSLPYIAGVSAGDGTGIAALRAVMAQHISTSLALMMLFMLRDLLILLWLSCGPWRSRADVAGLIYLAVVYWPLAAIFWVTGGQYLLPVVVPVATGSPVIDFLPIAIELVFAAFLFYARWREITRLKPR